MGLAGSLEDMPLQDILQIIHHSKKSGTLYLSGPRGEGTIVFKDGSIVQSFAPGTRVDIGQALLAGGRITKEVLAAAVAAQNRDAQARRLGSILVEQGAVRFEDIEDVVKGQIESAVSQLMQWPEGTFNLVLEEVPQYDTIAVALDELALPRGVDTQHLLLEALRTWDEQQRDAGPGAAAVPPPAAPAPPPEPPPPPSPASAEEAVPAVPRREALRTPVLAIVPDKELGEQLFAHLRDLGFPVEVTADATDAIEMLPLFCTGELRPILVLDPVAGTAASIPPAALLSRFRQTTPQVPVIGLARDASAELASALYRAGARNVLAKPQTAAELPAFLEELTALVAGIVEERKAAPIAPPAPPRRPAPGAAAEAELRRLIDDLKGQREAAAMTLSLLRVLSHRFDRGLFLYAQGDTLVSLGAFGTTSAGVPVAGLVKDLQVSVADNPSFAAALREGRPMVVRMPAEAGAFRPHDSIGLPASHEACLLPLISEGQPIALVYCDQGQRQEPVPSLAPFAAVLEPAARCFARAMSQGTEPTP